MSGIFAQLMAAIVFTKRLPHLWIEWSDKRAGEAALKKGYGKDPHVNGILAAFWALAARQAWSPELNRVSSATNISDAVSGGDLRHASTDDVVAILAKASGDIDYANSDAVDDMLRVSDFINF